MGGEGGPVSHVEFKKCLCRMTLSLVGLNPYVPSRFQEMSMSHVTRIVILLSFRVVNCPVVVTMETNLHGERFYPVLRGSCQRCIFVSGGRGFFCHEAYFRMHLPL